MVLETKEYQWKPYGVLWKPKENNYVFGFGFHREIKTKGFGFQKINV